MVFLITYNSEKEIAFSIATQVSNILESCGAVANIIEFSYISCDTSNKNEIFKDVDIVIIIGGDGTIIKVAKEAALANIPVLGVNLGRLGYLASVSSKELDVLKRLTNNDYSIESRAMLKAQVFEGDKLVLESECLNDIVVSKSALSTIIDISLKIDNDVINYSADGFIAATPTGSTAYSMSAGGPIIAPNLDCMVLTPVCPHTLMTRSLVNDGIKPIEMSVFDNKNNNIYLSSDGICSFEMKTGSTIKIGLSETRAKFIKLNDVSVYKVFSEKSNNN